MKPRLFRNVCRAALVPVFALSLPALAAIGKPAPVAPENMKQYEGNIGKSYTFTVTGVTNGSLWGTDTYTTDSNLSTAAVHAGAVAAGDTAEVEVVVAAGQPSYKGSTRNGVSSGDWEAYGGSYKFVKKSAGAGETAASPKTDTTQKAGGSAAPAAAGKPAPAGPENLADLADEGSQFGKPWDKVGKSYKFTVTGALLGTVFGSGPYTVDSNLATAAVHAGLVKPLAEAEVEVEFTEVSKDYKGSSANGVTTVDWPEPGRGFKFKKK